ncbi:hypothetical protein Adi01nite_08510 [Amorphoplanes digitatis]|nr:hypothetical protein GCM10020092_074290 [Actinoplanes digitatis]GID91439.1 hypothetical protein Adi01nite_08510 [Actinoplanes digitatis]
MTIGAAQAGAGAPETISAKAVKATMDIRNLKATVSPVFRLRTPSRRTGGKTNVNDSGPRHGAAYRDASMVDRPAIPVNGGRAEMS